MWIKLNDKTKKIIELSREKSETKRALVLSTIHIMEKEEQVINFTTVSKRANVSRNYLYKNKELKILIEFLRGDIEIRKVQSKDYKDIIIEAQKSKIKELEKKFESFDEFEKLSEKYNRLLHEYDELKVQLENVLNKKLPS